MIRPARVGVIQSVILRNERGDDVGGVPIERLSGSVVAHGGSRVGVTGCSLDVAEWDAGIDRRSDERVPEARCAARSAW